MATKLTKKQQAYYQRMRDTGGFADLGRKGGKANVAKHGVKHMEKIGQKGFEKNRSRFATEEEFRAYCSRVGSIKKGHGTQS